MSKAAELAALIANVNNGSSLANKNLIINGNFEIWQRSTSQTGSGSYAYGSADRWMIYGSGQTFARSTSVPSDTGLQYSITTTGTPSDEYNITQGIELPSTGNAGQFYVGQKITISYYAKSSSAGDRLWNALLFRNSVNSSTNQVVVDFDNTDNNSLTTSFQRFSKTYTIGDGVTPHANNACLSVQLRSRNSANDSSTPSGNITVTGVQLEIGEKATAFEHEPYEATLRKASRYYTEISRADNNTAHLVGYVQTAAVARYSFHVPMRTTPSITETNFGVMHGGGSEEAITSVDDITQDEQFVSFRANVSANLTAGQAVVLYSNGAATLTFDAEL